MGVVELFWGLVREVAVESLVVPPVGPFGGGPFDVRDGSLWPRMEHGRADAFSFEPTDHVLHQRATLRIIDSPGSGADSFEFEVRGEGEGDGRVFAPGIRVANEFPGFDGVSFTLALLGRHP